MMNRVGDVLAHNKVGDVMLIPHPLGESRTCQHEPCGFQGHPHWDCPHSLVSMEEDQVRREKYRILVYMGVHGLNITPRQCT